MTVTVSNTSNTNTFDYWRNRTNEIAHAVTTFAVTTESNTAAGNAAISGTFTSNAMVVNSNISVGNSTVNTQITAGNVNLNGSRLHIGNSTINSVMTEAGLVVSNSSAAVTISPAGSDGDANNAAYLGGAAAATYANLADPTFTGTVTVGNSTVNSSVNSTSIVVSNSSAAVTISPAGSDGDANNAAYLGGAAAATYANLADPTFTGTVTVGNSTVNSSVNSTSITAPKIVFSSGNTITDYHVSTSDPSGGSDGDIWIKIPT